MIIKEQTKKHILVVDDTPDNLNILDITLTNAGYNTLTASSGDYTLNLLSSADSLPDMILLDVIMPGLDGFETCRRLKTKPDTSKIPVIFMTALANVEDTVKGFEAGGVDYITKPFQNDEILARINTHMTINALQQQLEVKNTQLNEKNAQLHEKNAQLETALERVKLLSGILPICCNCKKIRNDEGSWQNVEVYVRDHSEAMFSHSICHGCKIELYPMEQYPELYKNGSGESEIENTSM